MKKFKGRMPMIIRPASLEQSKPLHEMTEKELENKICELEYRRLEVQKNKIPSIRKTLIEERLTQEINIYRAKLEQKAKEKKDANKP